MPGRRHHQLMMRLCRWAAACVVALLMGIFALAGALAGGTRLLSALHGPGCHDCLCRIHAVHASGVG